MPSGRARWSFASPLQRSKADRGRAEVPGLDELSNALRERCIRKAQRVAVSEHAQRSTNR